MNFLAGIGVLAIIYVIAKAYYNAKKNLVICMNVDIYKGVIFSITD
jgi:hypothetical protein